ncbi:MAG TPA: DUF4270 domain-containing protein [Pedobacter sp.]|jgi:hypothetical protein
MKYFKLDLLTLLIGLFLFSSCKKNGTIGLDVASDDLINSIFTDTITINTITVRDDSTLTSANPETVGQNALGLIKDPLLGTTEANLAIALSLPSEGFSFGDNPTLDSAILVLKYGDEFYGDSLSSKYVINVHQLTKPYNLGRNYYSSSSFPHDSLSNIGGINATRFAWRDSVRINTIVKGGADKPVIVAPQIRIPITSSFINSNFINANSNTFKTNTAFNNLIKGLYITVNKTQSAGTGGIIFIDPRSVISKLDIYYKTTTGTVIDTALASFPVATAASQIKHTRTTEVETQLNTTNTSASFATVYVQPLGGLRTKIKFPYLSKLNESGKISINKAELVIPVLDNTAVFPFKPAPRLALYRSDIAGQRVIIPDNFNQATFGGFYNATDKTYTFNVTNYIQSILSNKLVQYDTFIAPIDLPSTTTPNIFSSATTAARSVLGGGNHPTTRMKLKLTYTKPN